MTQDQVADPGLELAYAAACDVLKMQDQTLANVRSRATQVLSTAALLTSFSATLGLINLDPKQGDPLSTAGAWSILAVTLVIGTLVVYVQWTVRGWIFGPSAAKIMAQRAVTPGIDALREFVIEALTTGIDANEQNLKKRQKAFRWAAIGLILEVACLLLAVA